MLSNLPQWTGTTGNLRGVGSHPAAADPKPESEGWRPDAEQWIGGDTERSHEQDGRPGERLPVFAIWGHPQTRLCEMVLTCRPLAAEAAALSFMSRGPHDVRPDILLAMFGQDGRAVLRCLEYGRRYLGVWARRLSTGARPEALRMAAADGLGVLFAARYPRRPGQGTPARSIPSADARARSLGIRADSYRDLRAKAINVYRRRLREACIAYHAGRIHTLDSPYSSVEGMSPPDCIPPRELRPETWQKLSECAA